jgi:hypothetical protein
MNHLSEAELVAHYYRESANMTECERHLKECAACAKYYAVLGRDLDAVKPPKPLVRGEAYSEQVWQSIRASLPVYEKAKPSWRLRHFWQPLGWAAACALLIAAGFLAGSHWQRKQTPQVVVAAAPGARQRVVVVVLGDHLDRSERLLVALNHAEAHDSSALLLPAEAEELLATNRLVRQSTGDRQVEASLDRLERLLVELANQPGGLTEEDLNRLRQQMNTEGLLFDIRVLQARVHSQAVPTTKGASI